MAEELTPNARGLHERRLRAATPELKRLVEEGHNALSPEFTAWQESVSYTLERLFGATPSSYTSRFKGLSFLNLRVGPIRWNDGDQKRFDGDVRNAQRILADAIEELDATRAPVVEQGGATDDSQFHGLANPRLFISHSSRDVGYVVQLIELIRSALNLPQEAIRCTSVDGYRLRGGADTKRQLRMEIHQTQAFVGIITPASLESHFVLFELGARWGAGKHLVPLLAGGISANAIGSPISDLNALRGDTAGGLAQLLADLGDELGLRASSAASYQANLTSVAIAGADRVAPATPAKGTSSSPDLIDEAQIILLEAVTDPSPSILRVRTFGGVAIQVNRKVLTEGLDARSIARYEAGLKQLVEMGLIRPVGTKGEVFEVLHEGYLLAEELAPRT